MKYEFLFSNNKIVSYQEWVSGKTQAYTLNPSVILTLSEVVKYCDTWGYDYSLLVHDGMVVIEAVNNPELTQEISNSALGNKRIGVIRNESVSFALKNALLKVEIIEQDAENNIINSNIFIHRIDADDTVIVKDIVENEFNYLYKMMKEVGIINTGKQIILQNDENGT